MLAILLGWKMHDHPDCLAKKDGWVSRDWPTWVMRPDGALVSRAEIPRYCQSLDECARVEAGLTDEQWTEYLDHLYFNTFKPGAKDRDRQAVGASARQRTIALISTLQAKP